MGGLKLFLMKSRFDAVTCERADLVTRATVRTHVPTLTAPSPCVHMHRARVHHESRPALFVNTFVRLCVRASDTALRASQDHLWTNFKSTPLSANAAVIKSIAWMYASDPPHRAKRYVRTTCSAAARPENTYVRTYERQRHAKRTHIRRP